jgi:hypothetical protein
MKTDQQDSQIIAMQEQQTRLTGWQAHALVELTGILGSLLEFEKPQEITVRLKTIARDLEELYSDDLPELPPSSRPEINALTPKAAAPDAIEFLYPGLNDPA